MTNKHMERYSGPLVIKEVPIKTTMKSDFTLIRMAIIIKKQMENEF